MQVAGEHPLDGLAQRDPDRHEISLFGLADVPLLKWNRAEVAGEIDPDEFIRTAR